MVRQNELSSIALILFLSQDIFTKQGNADIKPPPWNRVLISACLLGQPVRYDGRSCPFECSLLSLWQAKGLLVPVCPGMDGGLPVPRPPAEITPGGGPGVWAGTARVMTRQADVTDFFIKGAQAALDKAVACGIKNGPFETEKPVLRKLPDL